MIHLMFLAASLGLVVAGQKLSLLALLRIQNRSLRRILQMLALAMPLITLFLFALTMLPALVVPETAHHANAAAHQDWLIAIIGFSLVCSPVGFALGFNLVRLFWLYLHIRRNSWQAPRELEKLAALSLQPSKTASLNPEPKAIFVKAAASSLKSRLPNSNSETKPGVQVRLWHSPRPFAFNMPNFWPGPGGRATIILSTGLIAKLDHEELQAVVWHEMAHLARHDFWIVWLANWWCNAFFYLPLGCRFLEFIQSEQEIACDDRVVDRGGVKSALALAAALLAVWEEMTARVVSVGSGRGEGNGRGRGRKVSKEILEPCFTTYFQPPGLAAPSKLTVNLTELRVNRLIEVGEAPDLLLKPPVEIKSNLKAGGLLGGSIGMWLVVLLTMHLVMLPLGCAISVHIM